MSFEQHLKSLGYVPLNEYLKIFDALVKAVLCFVSQIWGFLDDSRIRNVNVCIKMSKQRLVDLDCYTDMYINISSI